MAVVAQVSLTFQVENVSTGKLNISDTIQQICIKFHQNDSTANDHLILVTDDLEIVGQYQYLRTFSFLKREYSKKPTNV